MYAKIGNQANRNDRRCERKKNQQSDLSVSLNKYARVLDFFYWIFGTRDVFICIAFCLLHNLLMTF